MTEDLELLACIPKDVEIANFNNVCELPYGLTIEHLYRAMIDFVEFLEFINQELNTKKIPRLESFLMPANFSSIVGEFMGMNIPKYCRSLSRNQYHNGHPDLIPTDVHAHNSVQYATDGIEIKGSRHSSGWQGHNPEAVWLLVFHFDSNTSSDSRKAIRPKPFTFLGGYGAKLEKDDWNFSGRSETSRRTITASVNQKGISKMKANWIYQA